ncbi:low molecular weight protein tyrosine phosphatase family protein [Taklimakanibacter albus]|uniref:Low molecular weight protein tyrosine phosphatase family protein n=1 Tax=Taklimakanibacter albus TaxID=2800327 RepID=A0ACC5REK5_9HYPH|nr:low molecular weight protein tyrosine phosphatase family protein [Aestuariivirga sp. YIM B02566]MBK1871111.1 low molecular weight protein tyrosine phosphatase family protein [Aestuariivirga sp. YIM B02566]
MKNVLFVCSQNRLRSPTAEQVFSRRPDIEVASAGTNHDADTPLTAELVEWADIIFVMEKTHRNKLQQRFRASLKKARVICLDIPDEFEFMDPMLVRLLETRVSRYLP